MSVGTLSVRHDPSSAAVVRREITSDLTSRSVTLDSIADVVLVASELVGNAVVHSRVRSDVEIAWEVTGDSVLIRVVDGSDEGPQPRNAAVDATSGRGLAIVAALASEWGVARIGAGKQVWARIPVVLVL